MANDITVDSSEVRKLEKVFRTTAPKQLKKSMRRALSRTRSGSKKAASDSVRERYTIKASRMKKGVALTRPDYRSFSFRLIGRNAPISLSSFANVRQTKKGVTVAVIKGRRTLIRHAFLAKKLAMTSKRRGNTISFSSKANRHVFTRHFDSFVSPRLPVRALKGPSAADMIIGSEAVEGLTGYAQERFLEELQRNLRFFLGRT